MFHPLAVLHKHRLVAQWVQRQALGKRLVLLGPPTALIGPLALILDLSLELLQAVAAVVGNGLLQLVALGLVVLLLAGQRLNTRGQPFQLPLQLLPPLLK